MRNKMWPTAAAIILLILGSSCAEIRYVPVPLTRPARPVLETVAEAELQCLAPDVYRRLEARDRERRQYCETLEAIIDATQKGSDDGHH